MARRSGTGALTGLDQEQKYISDLIVQIGHRMGMSDRDIAIGIMTGMDESSLHNLKGGDSDSAGVFQQRPSQGWGSYAQVTDPNYAAHKFFSVLKGVSNRDSLTPWMAAQTVQGSAFQDGSNYEAFWNGPSNGFQVSAPQIAEYYKLNPGAVKDPGNTSSWPNPKSFPAKLTKKLRDRIVNLLIQLYKGEGINDPGYLKKRREYLNGLSDGDLVKEYSSYYKNQGSSPIDDSGLSGFLNDIALDTSSGIGQGLSMINSWEKAVEAVGAFFGALLWIFNVDHFMQFMLYAFGIIAIGIGLGMVTFGAGKGEAEVG